MFTDPMQTAYGTIKSLDPETGNGYIEPESGGDDIPFDRHSLAEDLHGGDLRTGDHVVYDVVGGLAGTEAVHIRPSSARAS